MFRMNLGQEVVGLEHYIKRVAGRRYAAYPMPNVRDLDDWCQEIAVRILAWGAKPARMQQLLGMTPEHRNRILRSKVHFLVRDLPRKNHRLGFDGRQGKKLPRVCAMGSE